MLAPLKLIFKEEGPFHHLDIIASYLGLIVGLAVFSLYYLLGSEQRDIGLTIFLASLLYLLLRKRLLARREVDVPSKKTTHLLLSIAFYSLYTVTIILLYLNLYFRPTSYFILISLMAGITAIDILFYKQGHSILPIFVKIFALSINVRAGIWYNFPTFSGSDVYAHSSIIEMIASNGYIPPFEIFGKYYFTPLSHIFVSVAQILCQETTKNSIFTFALIISILIIFVYLVGREIASPRAGLLAALILSLINSVIQYAFVNYTPSVLSFCYFLGIFYLLFKIIAFNQYSVPNILLLVFLSITSIFTHQLSSFAILTAIFAVCCMHFICRFGEPGNKLWFLTRYLLLLIIVLLFQWFYSYVTTGCSFFEFVFRPFINDFLGDKSYEVGELIRGTTSSEPFLTTVVSSLPYTVPVFFAIGGVLLWLTSRDSKKMQIIAPIIVMYAIVYGFPMIGMRNLLTDRWLPFLSIFLCLVIAAYILSIANIPRSKIMKFAVISIIVASFCFVMIITPGINKDNPIIRSDATVRNQFTAIEVTGMDTLTSMAAGTIKSDAAYLLLQRSELETSQTYTSMSLDYVAGTEFSDQPNTLIAIRKCGMTEPFTFGTNKRGISATEYLPGHFLDRFNSPQHDLIYSNEKVLGYLTK